MDELIHAYAAGFFDGEGNIHRQGRTIALSVWQVEMAPLFLLRDYYGGGIHLHLQNEWHKPIYSWDMSRRVNVIRALELWVPHLMVKRSQALEALEWYRAHPPKMSKL